MKLELPRVTLACIDTREPMEARRVLNHCESLVKFKKTVFLSNHLMATHRIQQINSVQEYSFVVFKLLANYIETEFCLIVQADGFIVHTDSWTDEFLDYDYIGAPWGHRSGLVGNGGFSLRSTRLMHELQSPYYDEFHPEDDRICRLYGTELIKKGFRFAPTELAERFSFEPNGYKPTIPICFGVHGFKLK